jgi:hypothetical protein
MWRGNQVLVEGVDLMIELNWNLRTNVINNFDTTIFQKQGHRDENLQNLLNL